WRGGDRFDRAVARSRRLTTAQEQLGRALSQGGGALVVLARFAPAGRSVVSLTAGVTHRRAREFVPWSALAGVAWAAYSVGLGYLGAQWLGASWLGTAVSVLALFLAGGLAAYLIRREPDSGADVAAEPERADTARAEPAPEVSSAGSLLPGPTTFPLLPVFAVLPAMRAGGDTEEPSVTTALPSAPG
ncbi:hypothetical protein AN220_22645, partial [Streptomyces nanshensis]